MEAKPIRTLRCLLWLILGACFLSPALAAACDYSKADLAQEKGDDLLLARALMDLLQTCDAEPLTNYLGYGLRPQEQSFAGLKTSSKTPISVELRYIRVRREFAFGELCQAAWQASQLLEKYPMHALVVLDKRNLTVLAGTKWCSGTAWNGGVVGDALESRARLEITAWNDLSEVAWDMTECSSTPIRRKEEARKKYLKDFKDSSHWLQVRWDDLRDEGCTHEGGEPSLDCLADIEAYIKKGYGPEWEARAHLLAVVHYEGFLNDPSTLDELRPEELQEMLKKAVFHYDQAQKLFPELVDTKRPRREDYEVFLPAKRRGDIGP